MQHSFQKRVKGRLETRDEVQDAAARASHWSVGKSTCKEPEFADFETTPLPLPHTGIEPYRLSAFRSTMIQYSSSRL